MDRGSYLDKRERPKPFKKKKGKKAKWLSEEALQIAKKREVKGKRERERYTQLNAENSKER